MSAVTVDDPLPFVGPRPLESSEAALFHGRQHEIEDLVDRLRTEPVVILRGPSGVGKTSLLRAGVQPEIEKLRTAGRIRGRLVVLREWGPSTEASDILADAYVRAAELKDASGLSFSDIIDREAAEHGRVVLILDQFEEVLRIRGRKQGVIASLAEVLRSSTPLNILISLREEYVAELGPLESVVGGLLVRRAYPLAPMSTENLTTAIIAAAAARHFVVTPEAVGPVIEWVRRRNGEANVEANASLLVTVTIMRELCERALSTRRVDKSVVDAYSAWPHGEEPAGHDGKTSAVKPPERIVSEALVRWIERAVVTPAIYDAKRVRPALLEGSEAELRGLERVFARRMSGALSSGGYKLLLSQDDLSRRVLGPDLRALGLDPSVVLGKHGSAPVNIRADRAAFLSGPALRCGWKDDLPTFHLRLGAAYTDLLLRLADKNVIKTSHEPDKQATIELVHDGLAQAFTLWGDEQAGSVHEAASVPTALRGADIVLRAITVQPLVNVLLWGCSFEGRAELEQRPQLRGMVFEDCDLRGTIFLGCDLTNVTFRRCKLPGVVFKNCTLGGPDGGVVFDKCEGDGLSVAFGELHGVEFTNCTLQQFTLESCRLYGRITFSRTALSASVFQDLSTNGEAAQISFDDECSGTFNSWTPECEKLLPRLKPWTMSGLLEVRKPVDHSEAPTPSTPKPSRPGA